MSIDDRTPTHPPSPVSQEHWCEEPGCNKWGGYGYRYLATEEPRWWCFEHYPYKTLDRIKG